MFRKIKSFFIGAFRKVKNIWNRIWGKKTMANYLLECEIVGGEIDFEKDCKVRVRPCNVYQKSEMLPLEKSYGIALDKETNTPSGIEFSDGNGDASYIELTVAVDLSKSTSQDKQDAAARPILNASMATAILSCTGMRVVLELDNRLTTVVGFKAQF